MIEGTKRWFAYTRNIFIFHIGKNVFDVYINYK